MRLWLLLAAMSSAFSNIEAAPHGATVEFRGEFAQVQSNQSECAQLFEVLQYNLKGFVLGPTGHTFVLNFQSAEKTGFFHGMNLVGRLGPSNDFQVDKDFANDRRYEVTAGGLVSYDVLIADVRVAIFPVDSSTKEPVCVATAELSAFNR